MYAPPVAPYCGPIGMPPVWITGTPLTIFVCPFETTGIFLPFFTTESPSLTSFGGMCETCET